MLFKGDYLRVSTPITMDGKTPVIVEGVQQFKETFLPLGAMQSLNMLNKDLPDILKKKIDLISAKQIDNNQNKNKQK